MSLTKTPICDFGKQAENFKLKSTDGKFLKLEDLKGKNGTLIMFICNHCPYVKAIISDVVRDCNVLLKLGAVSYTHLRAHETRGQSRMPSSA